MTGSRFDEAVGTAWVAFEDRLRAALESLGNDVMVINVQAETSGVGCAPYVQFLGDDGVVCSEVSSNEYLDPVCELDSVQQQALSALGWEAPDEGQPNWWQDVDRDQLDVLLTSVLAVLRQVLGVLHPDLLSWKGATEPARGPAVDASAEPDVSPADLQALVEEAVARHLGEDEVTTDDDGDIPIQARDVPIWVRVLEDDPAIRIFSLVVVNVTSTRQARIEADILNRRHRYLKFLVHDRQVVATVDLPAAPFAAQHLRDMLHHADEVLNDIVEDLALRTGGRPFFAGGPSRPRRSA